MAVFDYIVGPRQTELRTLMEDSATAHFAMNGVVSCTAEKFGLQVKLEERERNRGEP